MTRTSRPLPRLALACAVLIVTAAAAEAAVTGGGAMPYDAGLTTFSASIRGTVAGILIVIGVVGGVGMWIAGGQLDGMLQTIARVIIGACIVGGVVAFLSAIGVAGAVI